jgi:hypothetical protein
MTRDDIIRMAREAGAFTEDLHCVTVTLEIAERFAALVTEAEREACAKVCDLVAREIDDTNGIATYIAAAIRARGTT